MSDRQKKTFVWVAAFLAAVLLFIAAGCAPTASQVKLLQLDVATLTSIAISNERRTPDQIQRIGYHGQRIQDQIGALR